MNISKEQIDLRKKEISSLEVKLREAQNDSLVIKGKLDSTKEQLLKLETECMDKFGVPADKLEENIETWMTEIESSFAQISALFNQNPIPEENQETVSDPTSGFQMYEESTVPNGTGF